MSPELPVLRPLGVHPVSQVGDEVVEDHGVHILTQLKETVTEEDHNGRRRSSAMAGNVDLNLHEDEPVSEPELLHDDGDVVPVAGLGAATEH